MLKFTVVRDAGGAGEVSLAGAFLFGSGNQTQAGATARLAGGEIVCEGLTGPSSGLGLEYAVPRIDPQTGNVSRGRALFLRTCLLPAREKPYLLTLELARRRLMLVIGKVEEWGLFDDPGAAEAMASVEEARRVFTEAISMTGGAAEMEPPARLALAAAMTAGDAIAAHRADRGLKERGAGELHAEAHERAEALHAMDTPGGSAIVRSPGGVGLILPGVPKVGCVVNPAAFAEATTRAVAASCDFISVPMRWRGLEPKEGSYSFGPTDKWIEWAVRKARLPVAAGPIIDLRANCAPEWLSIWENDYETLRELVYEHVRQVVTRYRRTVARWTVVSGLAVNENFNLTYEKMADLTRICATVVRKLQPAAKIGVEVTKPWGGYAATNENAIGPESYLHLLNQAIVDYDGIVLRIEMESGSPERDAVATAELLDVYASFDRPMHLVLGAPSASDEESAKWRGGWSAERQANWLDTMVRLAAGQHGVESICWQELLDGSAALEDPAGGLLTASGEPKPAFARLADWRRRIRAAAETHAEGSAVP